MKDNPDDQEAGRQAFPEGTFAKLSVFVDLLRKWNHAVNLVSQNSLAEVWGRHVLDSAQVLHAVPDSSGHWADLGSGAGFPGIIIAILADARGQDLHVTMVESDLRKAEFLRVVSRETNVRTTVVAQRIESLPPLGANVVSARALAPLTQLCAFASRHLLPGGVAVFPKGATARDEVLVAQKRWAFAHKALPSTTDPAATLLVLKGIVHA